MPRLPRQTQEGGADSLYDRPVGGVAATRNLSKSLREKTISDIRVMFKNGVSKKCEDLLPKTIDESYECIHIVLKNVKVKVGIISFEPKLLVVSRYHMVPEETNPAKPISKHPAARPVPPQSECKILHICLDDSINKTYQTDFYPDLMDFFNMPRIDIDAESAATPGMLAQQRPERDFLKRLSDAERRDVEAQEAVWNEGDVVFVHTWDRNQRKMIYRKAIVNSKATPMNNTPEAYKVTYSDGQHEKVFVTRMYKKPPEEPP